MMVKVCGMKDPQNMSEVGSLPVDLMGMIFYERSPRCLDPMFSTSSLTGTALKPKRVGVFVNATEWEVRAAILYFKLSYIQLHGNESPEYCRKIAGAVPVIKAFRVDKTFDFAQTKPYVDCTYFLFDARGQNYGGNGHKFNWDKLQEYQGSTPFLLSGGIGPGDAAAIGAVKHPQFIGIDLNSGFEVQPGLKDVKLLRSFLNDLDSTIGKHPEASLPFQPNKKQLK